MNRTCTTDRTVLDGKTDIKGFLQIPSGTRIIREKSAHRCESIGDSSRIRNQRSVKPATGYPWGLNSNACAAGPSAASVYLCFGKCRRPASTNYPANRLRCSNSPEFEKRPPRSCPNRAGVSVTMGPTIMSPRSRDGAIQIARGAGDLFRGLLCGDDCAELGIRVRSRNGVRL
jgi:hypothetical protein